MKTQLPAVAEAMRQDSTWNPARLVVWLIVENDRLRVWVRELEKENARLRSVRAPSPRSVVEGCYLAPHSTS